MRRTKILATLGPASAEANVVEAMLAAGLDAVRLNFSHGTHDWHAAAFRLVREAAQRARRPVAILQDLQGPKIRIGLVKGPGMEVPTGSQLVITTRDVPGENGVVSTQYAGLPNDVSPGERILLDDGRVALVVERVDGPDIVCRVIDGGVLSSNKGINVPGAALAAPALTDKDRDDVRFGLALGVDFVALSFVRRASDVEELRRLMQIEDMHAPIVAKIEKPQAIDNLDEIIAAADGVMVARGDLGIEVSLEMIPTFQKRIIERANQAGKLVITATQMLESMREQPIPTRAEVTDVANAILDGTDCLMLSAETATGKFPVEVVRRMASIAETTEETLYPFDRAVRHSSGPEAADFTGALARLAGHASREIDPRAIAVFTRSGRTARRVSDERPRAPIVAFTSDTVTYQRLALYWGVVPMAIDEMGTAADLVARGERLLCQAGCARIDDTVLFLLGTNTSPGATNSLKLARIGQPDM
jgi:pyruvate kinase